MGEGGGTLGEPFQNSLGVPRPIPYLLSSDCVVMPFLRPPRGQVYSLVHTCDSACHRATLSDSSDPNDTVAETNEQR